MAIETSSSWSHSYSFYGATSGSTEGQSTGSTSSLDIGFQATTNEPACATDDASVLTLSSEAIAVGQSTLALTEGEALVMADVSGTMTTADLLVLAASVTTDGDLAYTNTDANLEASPSFLSVTFTSDLLQTDSDGLTSSSLSISEISLLTVSGSDSILSEPILTSSGISEPAPISTSDEAAETASDNDPGLILTGNVAVVEFSAEATGADTWIDLSTQVLTIEDQLSLVVTETTIVAA